MSDGKPMNRDVEVGVSCQGLRGAYTYQATSPAELLTCDAKDVVQRAYYRLDRAVSASCREHLELAKKLDHMNDLLGIFFGREQAERDDRAREACRRRGWRADPKRFSLGDPGVLLVVKRPRYVYPRPSLVYDADEVSRSVPLAAEPAIDLRSFVPVDCGILGAIDVVLRSRGSDVTPEEHLCRVAMHAAWEVFGCAEDVEAAREPAGSRARHPQKQR